MSIPPSRRSERAASFPALSPDISADVMDGLCAAVPRPANTNAAADPLDRDATLISEVNDFRPRDLEEAILVSQVLAAHHCAMACFRHVEQQDPASKEASRLRRDAIALQRSAAAMLGALHKSLARPMLEDAADLLPRPTVPVAAAPAGRRPAQQQQCPLAPPSAARQAGADAAPPDQAAAEDAAPSATGAAAPQPAELPQRRDPLEGHPDLQRLRDRWDTLPRWEDMTMEERRETWGYKFTPPDDAKPSGEPPPA